MQNSTSTCTKKKIKPKKQTIRKKNELVYQKTNEQKKKKKDHAYTAKAGLASER